MKTKTIERICRQEESTHVKAKTIERMCRQQERTHKRFARRPAVTAAAAGTAVGRCQDVSPGRRKKNEACPGTSINVCFVRTQ